MRLLPLLFLVGCGYGARAQLGPTWQQNQGVGATAQLSALLPIVAGYGLVDFWKIGGWITAGPDEAAGGVLFGSDLMVLPGGMDQPRDKDRRGFGGGLQFEPRFGGDGVVFGGGPALTWGTCQRGKRHNWSTGGRKMAFSARWSDVNCRTVGFSPLVSRAWEDPEGWRVDGLFGVEWFKVTD